MSTLVLFPARLEAWFGPLSGTHPVFVLGVWTPAIACTAGAIPLSPGYAVSPALGIALIIGPVERFGWRGFALPALFHVQMNGPAWPDAQPCA